MTEEEIRMRCVELVIEHARKSLLFNEAPGIARQLEDYIRTGVDPRNRKVCAFCGKSNDEVAQLIAGPTAMICNECVELSADICAKTKRAQQVEPKGVQAAAGAHESQVIQRTVSAQTARNEALAPDGPAQSQERPDAPA